MNAPTPAHASRHLLLVEFTPEDITAFRWLEQGLAHLRVEDCSLLRAYRRLEQQVYDIVFIDIPRDATQMQLNLVRDLAQQLRMRRPTPVMVPMVDSGEQLGKGDSVLIQVCPVYLTRPLNLQDLLQIVQTFASPPQPRYGHPPLRVPTNSYT